MNRARNPLPLSNRKQVGDYIRSLAVMGSEVLVNSSHHAFVLLKRVASGQSAKPIAHFRIQRSKRATYVFYVTVDGERHRLAIGKAVEMLRERDR